MTKKKKRKKKKIDKPLARKLTKKRKNPNKIRNEKGKISTDSAEIQKKTEFMNNNYMPTNLTTWKKWTTLEAYSAPKLNQEEIDDLCNWPLEVKQNL